MTVSERALSFAIMVHEGQVRRNDQDKPFVLHPLIVGYILKQYGYSDEVVAAGYLHDVIEESQNSTHPYTLNDLSRLFGGRVASLVMATSATQGTWEERKKLIIKNAHDNYSEAKAIICADKIANLEDLKIYFTKIGYIDFSQYHRGEEEQRDYFQKICESLAHDWDDPIIYRLFKAYDDVFEVQDENYMKNVIFKDDQDAYFSRKKLEAQRDELFKLKTILGNTKPYIIEFSGTVKNDQATLMRVLNDFFSDGGFKIKVMEDHEIPHCKKEFITDKKSLSTVEKNLLIASAIESDLVEQIAGNQDIILTNRGLFNVLTWIQRMFMRGKLSDQRFCDYLNYYLPEIEKMVDCVMVCYTDPLIATRSACYDSLTMNIHQEHKEAYNSSYNMALDNCYNLLNGNGAKVDTTALSERDRTLKVAETLLPIMRENYIRQLKLMLDERKNNGY